jgi:hypothetical protein
LATQNDSLQEKKGKRGKKERKEVELWRPTPIHRKTNENPTTK